MAVSVKDVFGQDDSFSLGADWNVYYGSPEVADHAVMVPLAAGVNQLLALHATPLDSVEQMVRARVRAASGLDTDNIQLYARTETVEGGSPGVIGKAYYGELRSGRVAIGTYLASLPSPEELASGTIVLDANESHNVILKARDHERGVKLDLFVDDEVTPVLSFIDTRTVRPNGLLVGFSLTDANVTQQVSLTEFLAYVLRSAAVKAIRPPVTLMTLGDLIYQTKYRLDRSGNSQFPDDYMMNFLNFAQDEVYNELLPWAWAFRTLFFTTQDGVSMYELPLGVALLYDLRNASLGYQLSQVTERDLNRVAPSRSSTGSPYAMTVTGRGDFGSLLVRLEPTPTGQHVLEVPYYARPTPMSEYTDIPLIPPNYLEILVLGALKRGSQYDTDKVFNQQTNQTWERMMNRMKRANYTDLKALPRLRTGNELFREQVRGTTGVVTRAAQLGIG